MVGEGTTFTVRLSTVELGLVPERYTGPVRFIALARYVSALIVPAELRNPRRGS